MGCFDLPTGEVKLKVKDGQKTYWKSVMFTDYLERGAVEELQERWGKKYKILEIQYNGRKVTPAKRYHWELRHKDEVYGTFKTREEAVKAREERNRRRWNGEKIPVGTIDFVEEIKLRRTKP